MDAAVKPRPLLIAKLPLHSRQFLSIGFQVSGRTIVCCDGRFESGNSDWERSFIWSRIARNRTFFRDKPNGYLKSVHRFLRRRTLSVFDGSSLQEKNVRFNFHVSNICSNNCSQFRCTQFSTDLHMRLKIWCNIKQYQTNNFLYFVSK